MDAAALLRGGLITGGRADRQATGPPGHRHLHKSTLLYRSEVAVVCVAVEESRKMSPGASHVFPGYILPMKLPSCLPDVRPLLL